jgi:hypothetical protein
MVECFQTLRILAKADTSLSILEGYFAHLLRSMEPPSSASKSHTSDSPRLNGKKLSSGGTYGAYLEEEERATRERLASRALEVVDVLVRNLAAQSLPGKGTGKENGAVGRLFELVGEVLIFLGEGEESHVGGKEGKKVQVNQRVAEFVVHFIRSGMFSLLA